MFPAFGNDAGSPSVDSPEQMQKNDPLGTQIWKLYSRAKTQLPNAERMENLTWRMMAMNMRRAGLDRNRGYECRHAPLAYRAVPLSALLLTRRFSCIDLRIAVRAPI
jgi:GATA-binding protein